MNKQYIKITLLFTSSLTIMAGATIAPALPQIQHYFAGQPHSEILTKLVLTVPAFFIAICAPVAGALIDRFGRIKLLLGSLILYGFTGTSGFFMDHLYTLLISRAFLGMAVAGVMTTTITLIADYFDGVERYTFMGIQGAFIALGGVLFITSGGLLAEISWRTPFLIYICAFIIFPAALYFLHEPDVKSLRDVTFRLHKPEYQKSLVVLIYVTALIGMMLFYIIPVQIPFYIKAQTGASNTFIGLAIASSTLSSALVSINYNRIKARWSFALIYSFAFLFLGTGYFIIFLASDYLSITLGLLVGGIGMGVLIPNSNVWIVTLSPESMRGRIVGGLTTSIFVGQFVSPIFVEPVVSWTSINGVYAVACTGMLLISIGYLIFHLITPKNTIPPEAIKKLPH
jgi:MFS family permease